MPTTNKDLLQKRIAVKSIPEFIDEFDYTYISKYLHSFESQPISNQPWPYYKTTAMASFIIAHNRQNLILKFVVTEKELNAAVRQTNEEVHKDNCVELFLAIGDNDAYYNLEFNCLGSAKIGYGKDKENRIMLTKEVIDKIQVATSLNYRNNHSDHRFSWEITLIIPKGTFQFSEITTFKGLKCKANFHKCGDDLVEPHFLTWNAIETELPDFHQPNFFGDLIFE